MVFRSQTVYRKPYTLSFGRVSFLILSCFLMNGCAFLSSFYQHIPEFSKPQIEEIIDLGGLPIQVEKGKAKISKKHSDLIFSPGEWIAVHGKFLSKSNLLIDGQAIDIHHELKSHKKYGVRTLIAQIPTGLNKLQEHTLTVKTPFGQDNIKFFTQHFIIGSDPQGNALQLLQTNATIKGYIEPLRQKISQPTPLFNVLHPTGNILYSIGHIAPQDNANSAQQIQINTIHLSASPQAETVTSTFVNVKSAPTSAHISQNTLLISTQQEILLFDLNHILEPKETLNIDLSQLANSASINIIDALLTENSQNLILLDSDQHQLHWIDIENLQSPTLLNTVTLLPRSNFVGVIDLFPSLEKNHWWVLGGRNLHAFHTDPSHLDYRRMFQQKSLYKDYSKLLLVQAENNKLTVKQEIDLPEHHIPFYGQHTTQGIYLSTVDLGFFGNGRFNDKSFFKHVVKLMRQDIKVGKILKVDVDTKDYQVITQNPQIPYHLQIDPELGMVYTQLKLTEQSALPPIKIEWGINIKVRGSYGLRKENHKKVLPPYLLGYLTIQH